MRVLNSVPRGDPARRACGIHAFSVVAKFLDDRHQKLDIALKQFYVDDMLVIAKLETLIKALETRGN